MEPIGQTSVRENWVTFKQFLLSNKWFKCTEVHSAVGGVELEWGTEQTDYWLLTFPDSPGYISNLYGAYKDPFSGETLP